MLFGNEYAPAGSFISAVDFTWFVGGLLGSSLCHLHNLFMSTRLLNVEIYQWKSNNQRSGCRAFSLQKSSVKSMRAICASL